jgi:tricorn protease
MLFMVLLLFHETNTFSQGTRLLRQPSISQDQITFAYRGEIWVSDFDGQKVLRLTSTPAVESNPCFSPRREMDSFQFKQVRHTISLYCSF